MFAGLSQHGGMRPWGWPWWSRGLEGRWKLDDWGGWVRGRWHRTAEKTVLSTLSEEGPQSLLWGGTPQSLDGNRSWYSEPGSGSPQVCPDGLRTLGWTKWEWHNWGRGAGWPYRWPPKFWSWTPSSTQQGFHDVESTWGSFDTVASIRAESEVGVQHDNQDFSGSVQQGNHVANSHLRVEPGLVGGAWGEQHHAMANCFPTAHLTKKDQSWFALISTSTMLGAEASNVKSLAKDLMSRSISHRWGSKTQSG